jgi:hypothetical protein
MPSGSVELKGPGFRPSWVTTRGLEMEEKRWRVGKLAHGPLRSRCPRAAPNPFLRDYAGVLRASMGQRSHETGYVGCSTGDLFFGWTATPLSQ